VTWAVEELEDELPKPGADDEFELIDGVVVAVDAAELEFAWLVDALDDDLLDSFAVALAIAPDWTARAPAIPSVPTLASIVVATVALLVRRRPVARAWTASS
jgi:hypothetical protein